MAGLTLLSTVVACERVPLLAPTGSTITLTTSTSVISSNESVEIVAHLLEASGTPPHSGTLVSFTTTLGRISPPDAETDSSGRVSVRYTAGTDSGTAVISATSGGASTGPTGVLKIAVGTAAVGAVRVNANPASVSALGGSTTITTNVLDINGNPLKGAAVVFSTTAGTLSFAVVTTDASGVAQTVLTTSQQATVTASVGAQATTSSGGSTGTGGTASPGTTAGGASTSGQASGTVTVTVSAAPNLVITPPTTPPSVGLPASFTFAVTAAAANGSAVRNLTVRWGDGSTQDLGAVTGTAVVSHTYQATGSYSVTGTLTDSAGNVQTVSTVVNVIPVASPTIIMSPSVPPSCTGTSACVVTFLLQVTPPTGVGIVNVSVSFGSTATPPNQGLGGLTGSATLSSRYPAGAGVQTVIVTVTDTVGRSTQGFTTINIP